MDLQILEVRSRKKLCLLENVKISATIADVKTLFSKKYPKFYPSRQSFRVEAKGKSLKDDIKLKDVEFAEGSSLLFKDLGTQVGWSTVFYTEYAGPLLIYLLFYVRPSVIYGDVSGGSNSNHLAVHLAAICHSAHYLKRLLETKFVHRFSHGTMPLMNIFKNSTYYWMFAAWQAYLINHPLYTSPGMNQVYGALAVFTLAETGNLVIHLALRDLRPKGSTERKIPFPTGNPFTNLFNLVSCPNYTYEVTSWIAFAVMTQNVGTIVFALLGFMQMAVWAKGKHRNYKKEFGNYPKQRKAIVPFLL